MARKPGNCASSLPRRRNRKDPMAAYDRLPAALRDWLKHAVLPWSPQSAHRAWQKAERRCGGDPRAMCAHLDRIEQAMLAKDSTGILPKPTAYSAGSIFAAANSNKGSAMRKGRAA